MSHIKGEHRFIVFENRVLRRIFGPKREREENWLMWSSVVRTLHQILFCSLFYDAVSVTRLYSIDGRVIT
jgi:hypothetical protein